MNRGKLSLLLSCEHASAKIPKRYAPLFQKNPEILETHRAYDLGAREAAGKLRKKFSAPLFSGEITRLLIDLNRSPTNRKSLHSEFSKNLPSSEREYLSMRYYEPYRRSVEGAVRREIGKGGSVFHLSVHSFTPVLRGRTRNADLGLLFDPSFPREKKAAEAWKKIFAEAAPELRVRFNYPYKGTMDGFTTYLRHRFSRSRYVSMELEINQSFYMEGPRAFGRLSGLIAETLQRLLFPENRRAGSNK